MTILIDTRTESAWEQHKPNAEEFQRELQKAFNQRNEESVKQKPSVEGQWRILCQYGLM